MSYFSKMILKSTLHHKQDPNTRSPPQPKRLRLFFNSFWMVVLSAVSLALLLLVWSSTTTTFFFSAEGDELQHKNHASKTSSNFLLNNNNQQWWRITKSKKKEISNNTNDDDDDDDDNDVFCQSDVANCFKPQCAARRSFISSSSSSSSADLPTMAQLASESCCVRNKWYDPPKMQKKFGDEDEFVCDNDDDDDRARVFGTTAAEQEEKLRALSFHQHALHRFKNFTSWMFRKWKNWDGECVPPRQIKNGGRMSGRHRLHHGHRRKRKGGQAKGEEGDGEAPPPPPRAGETKRRSDNDEDGLYELSQFCVSPIGRLAGYDPDELGEFRGGEDVFYVTGDTVQGVREWLGDIEHLTHLPPCFLDTSVVIFPLDNRLDNSGHAFHRAASMLRVIEKAYGGSGGGDVGKKLDAVTVMYVVLKPSSTFFGPIESSFMLSSGGSQQQQSNKNSKKKQQPHQHHYYSMNNAMRYFYKILGTSSFGVLAEWARHERSPAEIEKLLGFTPTPRTNPRICFARAVIWHNHHIDFMTGRDASGADAAAADEVGKSESFVMHGPRSARDVDTLHMIDSKLRACAKLPPRRRRSMTKTSSSSSSTIVVEPPHVMLAVRSSRRRFSLQPFLIHEVARFVKEKLFSPTSRNNNNNNNDGGATFEVLEHRALSFREVIERYSRTDVLLAHYGNALTWALFMPPGSVVVEFNLWPARFAHTSGINVNPTSEFGGGAQVARQWHIAVADDGLLARIPTLVQNVGDYDNVVSASMMRFALEKVSCLLAHLNRSSSSSGGGDGGSDTTLSKLLEFDPAAADDKQQKTKKQNLFLREHFQSLPVPSACAFQTSADDESIIIKMAKEQNADDNGEILARLCAIKLIVVDGNNEHHQSSSSNRKRNNKSGKKIASPYFSHRLLAMIQNRKIVARALRPFRTVAIHRVPPPPTSVLIIQRCELRPHVWAEFSALRQILQSVPHLVVAEFLDGREKCGGSGGDVGDDAPNPKLLSSKDAAKSWSLEPALVKATTRCVYPCNQYGKLGPFDLVIADVLDASRNVGGGGGGGVKQKVQQEEEKLRDRLFQEFVNPTHGVFLGFVDERNVDEEEYREQVRRRVVIKTASRT